MNWRRGLFRLWVIGTVLFVMAVAFISYSGIKEEFEVAARREAKVSATLGADADLAGAVYNRFYGDMPREQFDRKIAAAKPKKELVTRLEAMMAQLDTSRPLSQWSDDELLAYSILHPDTGIVPATNPWANVGRVVSIAVGFPLAVLALGASLMWGFSGFSAKRP